MTEDEVRRESAKKASGIKTRRSFLVGALGAAAGFEAYRWLARAPGDQLLPRPLRKGLNFNEAVSRAVFQERGLSPTYPLSEAGQLRINGNYGLKQDLLMDSYRLQMVGVDGAERRSHYVKDVTAWEYRYGAENKGDTGPNVKVRPGSEAAPANTGASTQVPATGAAPAAAADPYANMPPAFRAAFDAMAKANGGKPPRGNEEAGESDNTLDPGTPGLLLTMADVQALPRQEMVTQFKCIEGWSEIVQWGGYRLRDLLEAYPPARNAQGELPKYVYMETPNGDYYTGYELEACRHPQSLLVTEMMGAPLTQLHGAPLRLHMPIKYGYKQIKRIGLIAYTDDRPDDYWTKLGYDWYAGL